VQGPKYFDLVFEATKDDGIFSNIAIDDVVFVSGGSCEYLNSTTTSPTTTAAPKLELECDFETSLCDWEPISSTVKNWNRRQGKDFVPGTGSGPLNDVTLQNSYGYYAHLGPISWPESSTGTAILRSKVLTNLPSETCLEYWYQFGSQTNLKLAVVVTQNNGSKTLWQRTGAPDQVWSHSYVNIISDDSGNQTIEFQGIQAFHFI
jgi:hypothetical protein